jgi:hypothetical protein
VRDLVGLLDKTNATTSATSGDFQQIVTTRPAVNIIPGMRPEFVTESNLRDLGSTTRSSLFQSADEASLTSSPTRTPGQSPSDAEGKTRAGVDVTALPNNEFTADANTIRTGIDDAKSTSRKPGDSVVAGSNIADSRVPTTTVAADGRTTATTAADDSRLITTKAAESRVTSTTGPDNIVTVTTVTGDDRITVTITTGSKLPTTVSSESRVTTTGPADFSSNMSSDNRVSLVATDERVVTMAAVTTDNQGAVTSSIAGSPPFDNEVAAQGEKRVTSTTSPIFSEAVTPAKVTAAIFYDNPVVPTSAISDRPATPATATDSQVTSFTGIPDSSVSPASVTADSRINTDSVSNGNVVNLVNIPEESKDVTSDSRTTLPSVSKASNEIVTTVPAVLGTDSSGAAKVTTDSAGATAATATAIKSDDTAKSTVIMSTPETGRQTSSIHICSAHGGKTWGG